MSKITPVRWWRDDATRYQTRPPYVAPVIDHPEWSLDLITPSPELQTLLAEHDRKRSDELMRWVKPETYDPIEDVKTSLRMRWLRR